MASTPVQTLIACSNLTEPADRAKALATEKRNREEKQRREDLDAISKTRAELDEVKKKLSRKAG